MKVFVVEETTSSKVLWEGTRIVDAEKFIAELEKTDPEGVHAGKYGIDADEEAYIEYQKGKG